MRLDRFFSSQEVATRSEIKKLLRQKRVTVNGEVELRADRQIDPDTDQILLDGKQIAYQQYVYLMMNKPPGIVSATRDPKEQTVVDLVPPKWRRKGMFPAGRLDKDTVGLLLLTDDGALAHRLLSPKHHVEKAYRVGLDGVLGEQEQALLEQGITLGDGTRCLPCRIIRHPEWEATFVEMILKEGKYHQIKRMAAAVGRKVVYLQRIRMGGLVLDPDLPEGACKVLLHKDVERFLEAAATEIS